MIDYLLFIFIDINVGRQCSGTGSIGAKERRKEGGLGILTNVDR